MNGLMKTVSLWLVLGIVLVLALSKLSGNNTPTRQLGENDFVAQLELGNVEKVEVKEAGQQSWAYTVKLREEVEGNKTFKFQTNAMKDEWKAKALEVDTEFTIVPDGGILTTFLLNVVPFILIFGLFWFFMFRQVQGGSNKAMSFGKSRAKLANQSDKSATFDDVAGVDEAKEELQEIIEFLKDPKRFTCLGGKIPRGVLLIGSPGSGKTLLARAVAGEASVPFFSISGSDFVEMFVGVGASRVRDLFQQGHKHAPCIIFIDEIDAVGRQRGAGMGGGHDEREQTLNQLLVEMDGFNTNDGVILMAATNRPDVLDRALLRPGRFDRQIMVSNPDISGRKAILDIHLNNQKVPLAPDVETGVLARGTPGFSGADLANMVNEAALLAARRGQDAVNMIDFEDAKDRVMMGPARLSLIMNPEEKKSTAYHEAGHTLVGRLLPDSDPVHKVTIIPRGPTLGVTSMLPKEDKYSISKKHSLATIRVLMGGRAAEEIIFDQYTSGASNDLKVATSRAHAMVCEWGMSELGPISFGSNDEVFLGRDFTKMRDHSDETAAAVDREVHHILEEAYKDAKDMLIEHKNILVALSEELYERETLEGKEIDEIIRANGGSDLLPPEDHPKPPVQQTAEDPIANTSEEEKKDDDIKGIPPGDIVPDTA
jgi:cell division protease FtsH